MCDVVYERAGWQAYLGALLREAPRYGDVFAGRFARLTNLSPTTVRCLLTDDLDAAIDRLAGALTEAVTLSEHIAGLVADDVVQVLHGGPWPCGGGTLNDHVARIVAAHPDRFLGWAGVSLAEPTGGVAEATRAVDELGLTGLSVIPFLDRVDPSDAVHDPLWRFAVDRGLPVWIHSGQNFSSAAPMTISAPQVIDRIALRHPELKIVLGHGGWPWIPEAVALLQRHPNVYLEFSSHHPETMAQPGSGWEPLFLHGSRSLKHRVMFGSTSWTHGTSPGQIAAAAAALPLEDDVRAAWLRGNASRLLGLAGQVQR
ncbi:amidohydrolase family protein (plasmid) [Georgenia sp. TF02-10]|uniref:amidohydrolase family protein n=1 Tax=Georgenia sp. TF02-10 TaxID=2917725 RepID=UPI001FA6EBE0|nr:amidohydrolase family protein [Georgenia sp. TF02-10]UNX56603.1 amidohydrolase family protein [Georgenia sp. TF02-10]